MLRRLLRRLRSPVRIDISFEERSYKLGEVIGLTVQLAPRRDVEVGEARVELVCEERYAETYVKTTPLRYKTGMLKRTERELIDTVPERVVKQFKKSFVHSSEVLLESKTFPSGKPTALSARLRIQPDKPPHASGGKLKWSLVAAVEVDGKRHSTEPHAIEIEVE